MNTELNQKALDVVMVRYGSRHAGVIECYLKACNEKESEPKASPFDPALVKPGDEVVVNDGAHAPYKFVGMTSRGIVVCENCDGMVCERFPDQITIPPKCTTVKVRLFRSRHGVYAITENAWLAYVDNSGWTPCSDIVEIEVTE